MVQDCPLFTKVIANNRAKRVLRRLLTVNALELLDAPSDDDDEEKAEVNNPDGTTDDILEEDFR